MRGTIAVGVAIVFLVCGCGGGKETTAAEPAPPPISPEARAAAAALARGPFSEPLEGGLKVKGLRKIGLADPSAADRIEAIELLVDTRKAPPHTRVSAHVELYPTPGAAIERGNARVDLLKRWLGADAVGGPLSYCAPATLHGEKAWECGGTRGRAFAQAIVTPRGNAHPYAEPARTLAIGVMSALLGYAEKSGA